MSLEFETEEELELPEGGRLRVREDVGGELP